MRIGLICRSADNSVSRPLLRLAEDIAVQNGECFIFAGEGGRLPSGKPQPFFSFLTAVNGRIRPVKVAVQKLPAVQVFTVAAEDELAFAAAVAATCRRLLLAKKRIDWLHCFAAGDVTAAVLCRKYLRIPFVFSVNSVTGCRQPKKDLASLGISFNDSLTFGEYVFLEQLGASGAEYVCDETGDARYWRLFFAAYGSKYVEGRPWADTAFWSERQNKTRRQRKEELQASLGTNKPVVVACQRVPSPELAELHKDCCFLKDDGSPQKRRAVYQAADFYLAGEEESPWRLPGIMAAGCIPLAAAKSPAGRFLQRLSGSGIACFFAEENLYDALLQAKKELLTRPEKAAVRRQRAVMLVQKECSPAAAAECYSLIYQGFAPVRLPFVTDSQTPD